MSWLSSAWNSITGKTANDLQQQLIAQQQQQYQQQAAQAAAAQQRQAALEAQRQTNINQGVSSIDQAFSRFNEPFFQNAAKTYSDYYLPQIDEAAGQTKNKLVAQLFNRGQLESTAGINALSDLEKRRLNERGRIGSEATDFVGNIRNQVTNSRNNLYDYARSAADPTGAAARAVGEATTLAQAPGGYTQKGAGIGDIFTSLLQPSANAFAGYQNRLPFGYGGSSHPTNVGSAIRIYG